MNQENLQRSKAKLAELREGICGALKLEGESTSDTLKRIRIEAIMILTEKFDFEKRYTQLSSA